MKRILAKETVNKIGQKVRLAGWVNARRDHGKIIFIDLRDRSGLVQIVGGKSLENLRPEYVVELEGEVKKRPQEMANPCLPTGKVEVRAEKIKILAEAKSLPIDMGAEVLKVELPTLLDQRSLTLRHPRVKAIFKVQETIVAAFRETLKNLDFVEFQAPSFIPLPPEGGAAVFKVGYFNYETYLAQSPQLYKQILVGVFERVFTVNKVFRAEPSVTTRHMSEFVGLDAELGFIDSWEEIMDVVEKVVREMFAAVEEKNTKELLIYKTLTPQLPKGKIPKIKMRRAQKIILERTGRNNTGEPDLSPEDEKEICKWSKEKYHSELIFVTHYPANKRPFYTYPDPKDPNYTLSFDLLGRGVEWATGGQRINNYAQLLTNAQKWGVKKKELELYLQAFRYGMPPEGGFGMGLERITMNILNLKNVREASLFPRDMERVDVRLSTIYKKKEGKITS